MHLGLYFLQFLKKVFLINMNALISYAWTKYVLSSRCTKHFLFLIHENHLFSLCNYARNNYWLNIFDVLFIIFHCQLFNIYEITQLLHS
jgi:hypothetical protein